MSGMSPSMVTKKRLLHSAETPVLTEDNIPKGYSLGEHNSNGGKEIEKWEDGVVTIGGYIPQFRQPKLRSGHMIAAREVQGIYYYPGYDVALCLINNPDLLPRQWFKRGLEVGFWGTTFDHEKRGQICVAVLSLKKNKLVCQIRSLQTTFGKNHRIIVGQ